MTLVWIALLVAFVAIVGSITFVVVRAVELWRAIRGFFSAVGTTADELGRRADALAAREVRVERLEPALDRLRRSSAQLAVLRKELKRVREQTSAALVLYPRK